MLVKQKEFLRSHVNYNLELHFQVLVNVSTACCIVVG